MKWFLDTYTYWYELAKDIRTWWIFRSVAKKNVDVLNNQKLRVDWLGRIYGVVNLPEEVMTASQEIQQAYVLQQITTYGNTIMKIGLGDVVYPQIEKIEGSPAYLVVLWPVFDALSLLPILLNIIRTGLVTFVLFIIAKFIYNEADVFTALWDKFANWLKA
jgi:hypothetical protein